METITRWSDYQEDIFEAVAERKESLIIEAVAGSGKTTTIVEAIRHVPSKQSVAFLAFNKSIAEELKRRVTSPNAKCMTLHSAGFTAWRRFAFPENPTVDSGKTREMMQRLEDKHRRQWKGDMTKLLGLAKSAGIVPGAGPLGETQVIGDKCYTGLTPDDEDVWRDLIEFYGLDLDPDGDIDWDEEPESLISERIGIVRRVLRHSIEAAQVTIDYDDMLYMPIIAGAPFDKYDVVFLDEVQDLNGIQIEMVSRMLARGGRIVAVGDRHQAIYGFRGALVSSMDHVRKRFECEELPLSVSYRCPKEVVRKAQEWVPQIEFHVEAELGFVASVSSWKLQDFRPGDAILCRLSRPTVELAFTLIRAKVPAQVMGRDIGQGLIKLIDKMKAGDLADLMCKLTKYEAREVVRAKGNEAKISALRDRMATIDVFISEAGPDATVEDVKWSIQALFGERDSPGSTVTLSTVHKAKGLEWDRVFILDAQEYMPIPWARKDWQRAQEDNLCYVACTRARKELRYISSETLV